MVSGENLRVVLRHSAPNSSEILNVFHYAYSGAGDTDPDVLSAVDTFFTTVWGPTWADYAADEVTMDEIELDVLDDTGLVTRNVGSAPIGVSGGVATDMCATGVAALLTADTIFPKQRGRKFICGINEGSITDSLIIAGVVAKLALQTIDYLADITGILNGQLTPGILSRTLDNFVAFESSGAVTDVPAYQRRRKPNVGS